MLNKTAQPITLDFSQPITVEELDKIHLQEFGINNFKESDKTIKVDYSKF